MNRRTTPFSTNWFARPHPNPDAETRLFLFPYAGGGPAAFGKWPAALPGGIEPWIAHYPGRGSRFKEQAIKQMDVLVDMLSQAIQPYLDKPFAFFGHSLGGLVAFELARRLHRQTLPQPEILFISACGAPGVPDPHPPIHTLPDAAFLQAVQERNGIPEQIIQVPELLELLLPTLRADFEAVERYEYHPDGHLLPCPFVAFGGRDDARVSPERLEAWGSLTGAGFRSRTFPGDHFFLDTARDAVIASVSEALISADAKR